MELMAVRYSWLLQHAVVNLFVKLTTSAHNELIWKAGSNNRQMRTLFKGTETEWKRDEHNFNLYRYYEEF
jgi:hypothetical protein